jgi:hypothetical protein
MAAKTVATYATDCTMFARWFVESTGENFRSSAVTPSTPLMDRTLEEHALRGRFLPAHKAAGGTRRETRKQAEPRYGGSLADLVKANPAESPP